MIKNNSQSTGTKGKNEETVETVSQTARHKEKKNQER